jgi:8-oxo-dGTP pyrophosphatase MutT (NUDIX family)
MDPFPLLDELRTLAQNGLRYADDPYDEARYERLLALASEYYGEALDLPPASVRERFAEELGHVTPKVGGRAAIFDDEGRALLIERADDGTWSQPGGYTEPNETPAETALRETKEETGLEVEPVELVGVYPRRPGEYGPHGLVGVVYLCEVVGGEFEPSRERVDIDYLPVEEVPEWHKDHRTSVADARAVWERR